MALAQSRPTGLLRLALHLPIWLYRLHLGWLLGHRFLLLTHRGRATGRPRQAVIEVIRYDPTTRQSVVVSGWRGETDWYRNLLAHPALEIVTGTERYVPQQRFLDVTETAAELRAYVARHPLVAKRVLAAIFGLELDNTTQSYADAADFFRGVAFRPRSGSL